MFREKMTYPPNKIPTVVSALASFKKSHALVRFTRLILLQKRAGSTTYWYPRRAGTPGNTCTFERICIITFFLRNLMFIKN